MGKNVKLKEVVEATKRTADECVAAECAVAESRQAVGEAMASAELNEGSAATVKAAEKSLAGRIEVFEALKVKLEALLRRWGQAAGEAIQEKISAAGQAAEKSFEKMKEADDLTQKLEAQLEAAKGTSFGAGNEGRRWDRTKSDLKERADQRIAVRVGEPAEVLEKVRGDDLLPVDLVRLGELEREWTNGVQVTDGSRGTRWVRPAEVVLHIDVETGTILRDDRTLCEFVDDQRETPLGRTVQPEAIRRGTIAEQLLRELEGRRPDRD